MAAVDVSARNTRVPCPRPGCTYRAENAGSIPAHVAMAHKVPIDDHFPAAPAAIPPSVGAALAEIPLELVDVGTNVRVTVQEVAELAASIAEHGVLQPVKVAGPVLGRYVLVWGQRRVLAARVAGLATIPAVIVEFEELSARERSIEQLVENLHRADLNQIDRSTAMRAVVDSGVSQADLARTLGIAPSTVSNDLRILELAPAVQAALAEGRITPGHAKPLVGLAPKTQAEFVERIEHEGMTSKEVERRVGWERDNAEREKAHSQELAGELAGELAEQTKAILAKLEKAKVPKDVRIAVDTYYQRGNSGHVVDAIRKAGWTRVTNERFARRSSALGCDCTGWVVELGYRGRSSVEPACFEAAHRDAKVEAENKARTDGWELQGRVKALARSRFAADLAAVPLGLFTARILLWDVLDYRLSDWAKEWTARLVEVLGDVEPGAKKLPKDPWSVICRLSEAELAAEIATGLKERVRDRFNNKLPWAALEAELAPEVPA